jgi:hypothetical protein
MGCVCLGRHSRISSFCICLFYNCDQRLALMYRQTTSPGLIFVRILIFTHASSLEGYSPGTLRGRRLSLPFVSAITSETTSSWRASVSCALVPNHHHHGGTLIITHDKGMAWFSGGDDSCRVQSHTIMKDRIPTCSPALAKEWSHENIQWCV